MKSIIQQLQIEASEAKNPVSELLKKAKIVASKLELNDFLKWVNLELTGYGDKDEAPSYRIVKGDPRGWNPYNGWIPLLLGDADLQEMISESGISQPIGELENLLNNNDGKNLHIPFPERNRQVIAKAVNFDTKFILMVSPASVAGIIEAVRNSLLDWSLKLEKEGILGEGITFSIEEKKKAQKGKFYIKNIENFNGNLGDMSGQASITINNFTAQEKRELINLVEQVEKYKDQINLGNQEKLMVENNLRIIDEQAKTETPVVGIVKKSLSVIKTVMEGVSGNVIAQGVIALIQRFFGS